MACLRSNTPIDIDSTKTTGKCTLKCDLSFRYPNSTACTATHRGNYISLSYDPLNPDVHPVTYNKSSYYVREVRLFAPSLHTFVGSQMDGEMVVIHASTSGSAPLLICVPIKEGSDSDGGILTEIINAVASNAPSEGDATTITPTQPYTLNAFVPRKPFYTYTGIEPFQPCAAKVNCIVFAPPDNAVIYMQSDTLQTLKSILSAHPYVPAPSSLSPTLPFFRNDLGPGSGADGDDIFIDCQPVDQSDTMTTSKSSGSGGGSSGSGTSISLSWNTIKHNTAFQVIVGVVGFILLGGLLFAIVTALTGEVGIGGETNKTIDAVNKHKAAFSNAITGSIRTMRNKINNKK